MINRISQIVDLPNEFYDSIIEREQFSSTNIGNLIAIPHPNKPLSKEAFISVCVLSKPIIWDKESVQIIFLISISTNNKLEIKHAYKQITNFALSKKVPRDLIKQPTYKNFIAQLDGVF